MSNGWHPIATAPQDGRVILLTAFDDDGDQFETHRMQWSHIARNGLFPDRLGMWVAPRGEYTWNDDGIGGGPTHWQPDYDFAAIIAKGIPA
jgi:hypothetical protein